MSTLGRKAILGAFDLPARVSRQPIVIDVDLPAVLEAMPQLVWLTGPDGTTDYVNEQFRRYTGCPPDMISGWGSAIHPDDADEATFAWDFAAATRHSFDLDCRLRRADGEYRWHRLLARPIHNDANGAARWIGTATDIDDAKQLEVELRTPTQDVETSLLEALHLNAPIGLGFVDRDLRRVFVNEALASYNGSTVAEQIGRRVPDLVPAVWPQMEPMYRAVSGRGRDLPRRRGARPAHRVSPR